MAKAERICADIRALAAITQPFEGGVTRPGFTPEYRQDAVQMDKTLQAVLQTACRELGLRALPINSGAGHDSMVFAPYWPTAMLFLPCRDGISHNPAEYVRPEILEKGTDVLYNAILAIDQMEV